MTETNTCHSSATSTCFLLQPHSPPSPLALLKWILSYVLLVRGMPLWNLEDTSFTTPRLCSWTQHSLSRWPWPIRRHSHFLAPAESFILEWPNPGVGLGPSPCSCSLS